MDSGRLFFDSSRYGNMFFGNCDPIFRGARSVMGLQEPLKRRTFFTSPDEVFDEEYYDEQLPEKKRRLTPEQVHLLEQSFEEENKLEPERKTQLAKKVGLQPRQVAVWFQNHRARWKTKHLEREFNCLKSSYESLLSECDSIRKENKKLKAEVVSLTEKVQAKEVAGAKSDPVPEDAPILSPLQLNVKKACRLSRCSGGSAVVDEDGPLLMDSGDSYFLNDNYPGCMGPVDSLQSEEDDGSGDGQSFFSCALAAAEQQHQEDGEPLGWWVWS